MQIEAGKFYRTRGGERAFVAVEFPDSPFGGDEPRIRFAGYINGSKGIYGWTHSGLSCGISGIGDEDRDLIAEWREPVSLPVYLYQHGDATPFLSREEVNNACCRLLAKGRITEGEGMD